MTRRRPVPALNLANVLTCIRLVLSGVLVWLLLIEGMVSAYLALAVFSLASLTDWFDGYLARRYRLQTPFGIFMDPFADKVLVLSALLTFLWLNLAPVWIVLVITAREFIITSLRMVAEAHGETLGAIQSGKQKMVSQIIAIIGILAIQCAQYTITWAAGMPWDTALVRAGAGGAALARTLKVLPGLMLFIVMVLSVLSGIDFVRRHRRLFLPR